MSMKKALKYLRVYISGKFVLLTCCSHTSYHHLAYNCNLVWNVEFNFAFACIAFCIYTHLFIY